MKKGLSIFDILYPAPRGTMLYSPDYGDVYLHTVSNSNYYNGWLGNDKAINVTLKSPTHPRCQHGGVAQYRYEDIDYCFDEHGRLYAVDASYNGLRSDLSITNELTAANPGMTFVSNGRHLHTTDCRLFPDKDMTWENWQYKLFKPGDMVRIEYRTNYDKPDNKVIYIGYIKELRNSQLGKEFYLLLNDVIKEIEVDRRVNYEYMEKFVASVHSGHPLWLNLESGFTHKDIPCRFATADDSHWHWNIKQRLEHIKREGVKTVWDVGASAGFYSQYGTHK